MESTNINKLLTEPLAIFKEFNYGIMLIGTYFIFEFGSIQGLYPIVNGLKLPLLLSILTILYAIYLVAKKKLDYKSSTTRRFLFLCLFILIYTSISTVFYDQKIQIIKLFITYLSQYIIIVCTIKKPAQFILLIDIWLVSIVYSSFHGFFQGGMVWGNRWLNDENHIALITATSIPFAFILYKDFRSKLKKLFYIICLSFYVTINLVAASRGGALAMMIVAFLCWLLYKNRMRNLVFFVVAVALVISYAPDKFFSEMETLEQGAEQGTASDRIYLWQVALEMFKAYPLLGVGPDNYPPYFDRFKNVDSDVTWRYSDGHYLRVAHSTPMQWIAEMGIIGTIILLLLQKALYRNWKESKALAKKGDRSIYVNLSHACAISQIGFWFAAIFLTVIAYPFYWCLIPFSEAWRNIMLDYAKENGNSELEKQTESSVNVMQR